MGCVSFARSPLPAAWPQLGCLVPCPTAWSALTTCGAFQVPLRIEGDVSFGQYMRIIGRKSPFGAGSQLLPCPCRATRSGSTSSLNLGLLRMLTVNLFSGLGTNHQPSSIMYMVIDQKPSTGGVWPFANVSVYLLAPVSFAPVLSTSV